MNKPKYNHVVVLTGAGISAESGLKTFRDHDGLWEGHRVEDVATPEAFIANPTLVHQFYNARRRQLLNQAKPNSAHRALAEFAQRHSGTFTLITQNVDNLHEQAGSQNVIHMHGQLLQARCAACGYIEPCNDDISIETSCQACMNRGSVRPNIVWFGEVPIAMDTIMNAVSAADLFVAIGTSGNVYPAAGLVQLAGRAGAHTVELNLQPSEGQNEFVEHHYGPATQIVSQYFNRIL